MIGFGQFSISSGPNHSGGWAEETSDGGYIYVGRNSGNIFIAKTNSNGIEQWNQTYTGYLNSVVNNVKQTSDNGYIICGKTNSTLNAGYDVVLIKTDPNGNILWAKTFGGTNDESGSSVQQTTDGGYIITGSTQSFGNGGSDVYLIKTDGNGNEIWNKTFGGTDDDGMSSIQQTADGGYVMTGSTKSFGNGSSDVYLIKTDSNGNEIWNKTFGGVNRDAMSSVQQTNDGGYIMTGNTELQPGDEVLYILKTDINGLEVWSKTIINSNGYDNYGIDIQQTNDNGYIICGNAYRSVPNGDASTSCLIKLDQNGIEQWNKILFGPFDELFPIFEDVYYSKSVQQTSDGGFLICGSYIRSWEDDYCGMPIWESDYFIFLTKTDGNGNITSIFDIPSINNFNRKLLKVTDLLGRKTKGKKNEPQLYLYDDGTVEKRIVID